MKSIILSVMVFLIFVPQQGLCLVTDTSAWEPSSSIFAAYEYGRDMPFRSGYHCDQDLFVTNMKLMVPGETFGYGIEIPRINRRLRFSGNGFTEKNVSYEAWGDLKIVAKYQFGVYRNYRLLGKDRLLNVLVSLVGKLKLPSASTNLATLDNIPLPAHLQPGTGSTDTTLGAMIHFDSEKYFRIQTHFMYSFPISHDDFKPGESVHYALNFMLVRLGFRDQFYPTIGVKGRWHADNEMAGSAIKNTGGAHLYLDPGIRSSWWYFSGPEMFVMVESAVQIRLIDTSDMMPGPEYGLYIGVRAYFR